MVENDKKKQKMIVNDNKNQKVVEDENKKINKREKKK